MRRRLLKTALTMSALILTGLLYAYGAMNWGWWLPCVFNYVTGLECPGCGVSRMCLALLDFDVKRAFDCNPAVMICLPFLLYLFSYLAVRYILYGELHLKRHHEYLCIVMIVFLIGFGMWRNLKII